MRFPKVFYRHLIGESVENVRFLIYETRMLIMQIENPWIADLGLYEPGKPIEEVARELGFDSVDDICKLASNENSLGPSPLAIKAIKHAAEKMHYYPDGGSHYLREKLAELLHVQSDEIIVGNGSNELLEMVATVYLSPGKNIVMADRAFVVYRLVAPARQAQAIAVPMKDYRHDLDAMLAAINENTRIVFVANPNNPTGTIVSPGEIDAFMQRVPDHVAVVFDEAYIELMDPADRPDLIRYARARPHVYVLRTFSKAYGLAGLRVGYGIAGKREIALLHRVRQPFNVNAMGQIAALAALDDHEHVERTRLMVKDGLAFLEASFAQMGLTYVPSRVNFMLVRVGEGRRVFEALQRKKVIVRPVSNYNMPEWIRVSVGTAHENKKLIHAMKELMEEGIIQS